MPSKSALSGIALIVSQPFDGDMFKKEHLH
jgi:hypothetical protein